MEATEITLTTKVQASVNALIMLFAFAPIVTLLVSGASALTVPFIVLLYAVILFIVIPLVAGKCPSSGWLCLKGNFLSLTLLMDIF